MQKVRHGKAELVDCRAWQALEKLSLRSGSPRPDIVRRLQIAVLMPRLATSLSALALLAPSLLQVAWARRSAVQAHRHAEETAALQTSNQTTQTAPLLEFHIYRAGQSNYPAKISDWERSQNFANAGGVLRYIQNEVVGVKVVGSAKPPKCERKYNIDRIYRYKVTMRSTPEAFVKFKARNGFLGFVAIDKGKCTVPKCDDLWWKPYGYVPGCQDQDMSGHYPDSVWYSFPGRCPGLDRTQPCRPEVEELADPGGACRPSRSADGELTVPDGSKNCTFVYEPAGEITLDELVGIKKKYGDFKTFCMQGGVEFNGPNKDDEGVTLDFWKDYPNVERNKERIAAMLVLFQKKYPQLPILDDPGCSKQFKRPSYWPAAGATSATPAPSKTPAPVPSSPSPSPTTVTEPPETQPPTTTKSAAHRCAGAAALSALALLAVTQG